LRGTLLALLAAALLLAGCLCNSTLDLGLFEVNGRPHACATPRH
jgi:hypothetical protein